MKRIVGELRNDWVSGEWKPEGNVLFAGAELIVTDKPINNEKDVVVVTNYAAELSSLIFELRDRLAEYIDCANKYEFYPRLGLAANRCIKELGDNPASLINAVLDEASEIAEEWDAYLYFAYGSNMDELQMINRCPDARLIGISTVENMKFVLDSSGAASIVPQIGSRVTGVIWLVTKREIKSLDRYEGVSSGCYRKERISVTVNDQRCNALVYISNRDITHAGHRSGYMDRIIKAARHHRFDGRYIQELQSWGR